MFRPQRTTVLLAIAAEPAEKPDARFLALDRNSVPTPASQSLSLVNRIFEAARSGRRTAAWLQRAGIYEMAFSHY